MLFPEFLAGHFKKSLPGRTLEARPPVLVELFAGKYEHERWAKVKFRRLLISRGLCLWAESLATDRRIVRSFVTQTALFHVSAMYGLRWSARGRSLFARLAKRRIRASEVAGRPRRNAKAIDRMRIARGGLSDPGERLAGRGSTVRTP